MVLGDSTLESLTPSVNAPLAQFIFLHTSMGHAHTHLFGNKGIRTQTHGDMGLLACSISFIGLFLFWQVRPLDDECVTQIWVYSLGYRLDVGPHFDSALTLGKTILLYLEGRLPGKDFSSSKGKAFWQAKLPIPVGVLFFYVFLWYPSGNYHTHQVLREKLKIYSVNSLHQLMSSKSRIPKISTPWVKVVKCV
jgi:hypothetical protein